LVSNPLELALVSLKVELTGGGGRAADPMAAALWQAEFGHYRPLVERIIAQTERRVLHGEAVAANEKIVSLFEPHADIIVKGARDVMITSST